MGHQHKHQQGHHRGCRDRRQGAQTVIVQPQGEEAPGTTHEQPEDLVLEVVARVAVVDVALHLGTAEDHDQAEATEHEDAGEEPLVDAGGLVSQAGLRLRISDNAPARPVAAQAEEATFNSLQPASWK